MKKKFVLFFSTILFLIGIGQVAKLLAMKNLLTTKPIINGILNLTLVKNTGGAFGLGHNNTWILVVLNIVVIVCIIIYFLKSNENNKYKTIGFILLLSGGIGNLVDRIFKGYVIDYIDISNLIPYPVFNMEDILIIFGVVSIGIFLIKKEKNEQVHSK